MMGVGYGGLGMILMILFWITIVAAALWFLSRLFPQVTGFTAPPSNGKRSEPAENPMECQRSSAGPRSML